MRGLEVKFYPFNLGGGGSIEVVLTSALEVFPILQPSSTQIMTSSYQNDEMKYSTDLYSICRP